MKFPGFRRNERRTVIKTLLAAGIAAGLTAFGFVAIGAVDVAASDPHSWLTYQLLHFAFNRSVALRSDGIVAPGDLNAPSRVALGAQQFHIECSNCHGGPGIGQSPIALSMTPRPQSLPKVVGQFSDAELFWIVKHGVKFSAMPAWPTQSRDDEVWSLVAFLKQLPSMSAETYLKSVSPRPNAPDAPVIALRAPVTLKDADTRRNTYPKDEFLYAVPAIGFGDQGASVDAVEMCGRCHGDDGKGGATMGEAPDLTLQSAAYITASLTAYANGKRRSGFMQPIAAQLSQQQIEALADYYAGLPKPVAPVQATAADPRGAEIAARGLPAFAIPACATCHGSPISARIHAPEIAGQQAIYLRRQLTAMRDGDRGGNGEWNPMPAEAHVLTDADIATVAAYYAAQPAGAPAVEADRLALSGESEAGAKLFGAVCATCHGKLGAGDATGDVPNLTVQTADYMRHALRQYRAGLRDNVKMKLAAAKLDDATIDQLCRYVAGLAWQAAPVTIDPAASRRGEAIAKNGITDRGVPGCLSCHDRELTAALPLVARLDGQNPLYLEKKLDEFTHQPPDAATAFNPMPAIASLLTKSEQQDLAAYFGAQPALDRPR